MINAFESWQMSRIFFYLACQNHSHNTMFSRNSKKYSKPYTMLSLTGNVEARNCGKLFNTTNPLHLRVDISAGLKHFHQAWGQPNSVLISMLNLYWYQKSYPNGSVSPPFSQQPFTFHVCPSKTTNPPVDKNHAVWLQFWPVSRNIVQGYLGRDVEKWNLSGDFNKHTHICTL